MANGGLEIGAMTTLTDVVTHQVVREQYSIHVEGCELCVQDVVFHRPTA